MRIVFAGTPEFACPALQALMDSACAPVAVLTQPDRPAGRGRRLVESPVKQLARAANIEVLQPVTLKSAESQAALAAVNPDLIITAAYGLLLPQAVLDLPAFGCWNLHASLLPRWRGASPIQQAILHGDAESGVCLMQMDAGLDTGPVIMRREISIGPQANAQWLHDALARLAAELTNEALAALRAGELPDPVAQDNSGATHAPLIRKQDARLDWSRPAADLAAMVRAYNPWPVAFGTVGDQSVRVFEAWAGPHRNAPPGTVITGHGEDCLRIACGDGVLDITELQSAGKRRLPAKEWLNAHPHWR